MSGDTGSLKSAVAKLLETAEQEPQKVHLITLSKGLRVEARYAGGIVSLRISRARAEPSEKEWDTVMGALPYPVVVRPRKFEYNGRRYLSGAWAVQHSMFGGTQ